MACTLFTAAFLASSLSSPPSKRTTLSGLESSTPVAASQASLERLSHAMTRHAPPAKAPHWGTLTQPYQWWHRAPATRRGASATEYIGSLIARRHSSARVGVGCVTDSASPPPGDSPPGDSLDSALLLRRSSWKLASRATASNAVATC